MKNPWKIADKTFIYQLNNNGENYFYFNIQPGRRNDNKRTSDKELADIAESIMLVPELLNIVKILITADAVRDIPDKLAIVALAIHEAKELNL